MAVLRGGSTDEEETKNERQAYMIHVFVLTKRPQKNRCPNMQPSIDPRIKNMQHAFCVFDFYSTPSVDPYYSNDFAEAALLARPQKNCHILSFFSV